MSQKAMPPGANEIACMILATAGIGGYNDWLWPYNFGVRACRPNTTRLGAAACVRRDDYSNVKR